MSGSPQPFPGTCGPGYDDDVVCALVVNTTLYDPLFVPLGPPWEQMVSRGTQWFTVILSILMTGWFFYNMYTGHCGWEVIFVTIIELAKIFIELFWEYETPCMIYSVFGPVTSWLRYIEWLLTCPVILIHLSNLTGLDEEYSARTMNLLTSDQGTICFGITAALSPHGWIKIVLFLIGLSFGVNTFLTAARVYIESYHQVPKGRCRNLVKYLCGMFFCSWLLFPLLFIAGPEGTGYLTWSGSTIGHTVADLLSKNIWGLIAHYLQVKIREHILIHGDVRKTVEKTVAGHTFEIEEFADKDDEDAVVQTGKFDRRNSFQLIGAKLQKGGQELQYGHAAADDGGMMEKGEKEMQQMPMQMGGMPMQGMDQQAQQAQLMQMMQQMQQMQQQGGMMGMQQPQHMMYQQPQHSMSGGLSPGQMSPTHMMSGQMYPGPNMGIMSGQMSPGGNNPMMGGQPMSPGGQPMMGGMMPNMSM
mmetsp:Transcript_12019/g.30763  ORF Transcript_12019/g.30763 Transcript_12019/m.30763 type:complete len:472 (-) Transcript_12019:54-1469(-)